MFVKSVFSISDLEISGRMEDFVEKPADEDYGDFLDCAKLEELEKISQRLRHRLLPDLDAELGVLGGEIENAQNVQNAQNAQNVQTGQNAQNAQKQIELDQLDDERLEAISRRENELAAEMDEIDARLSQIRKMNTNKSKDGVKEDEIDARLSQIRKMNTVQSEEKSKDGVKEEKMNTVQQRDETKDGVKEEEKRKERELIENAEHELKRRGGGGFRREKFGFRQKEEAARNIGGKFDKSKRHSRNEHFSRERERERNILDFQRGFQRFENTRYTGLNALPWEHNFPAQTANETN